MSSALGSACAAGRGSGARGAAARVRFGFGAAGVVRSGVFGRDAGRLAMAVVSDPKILPIGADELMNTCERDPHPVGPVVKLVVQFAQRLVEGKGRQQHGL